jgi:uncharacterized protein
MRSRCDERKRPMNQTDQQETIAYLTQDAATRGKADVIRTHASILFLGGDRALKRAVRYAFLDYSTLEQRRRSCEDEVAVNRRLAPTLYLGVRRITRADDGQLAFDGQGQTVDWVVEMRRFAQDELFSEMARSGRLSEALVTELADCIVDFHHRAEPRPEHGGREGIAEVVSINERSFAATGLHADDLVAASSNALGQLAPLLEARRNRGHVRHCHGDLHLANIVLLEGRPTLFDGIEFSRNLACIDVLYDLAFLLMDLCHRGQQSHANIAFNRYLDLTDEAGGLAALPLFLSLRAGIRAHVSAAAGRSEATTYVELARQLLTWEPPRFVAIGGLSGTGKSVLAAALAPHLGRAPGARVVRSDVLRKRLFGRRPEEHLSGDAYADQVNRKVYEAAASHAEAALSAGQSVIIDAVAARPSERALFAAVAARRRVPLHGIWLTAPAAIIESRVEQRSGDASDATAAVVRRQLRYDTGKIEWTCIDSGGSPERTLGAVRAAIA